MGDFSKVVHWVLVAMAWLTEHPLQGHRFQDRFLELIHFCHSFSFETVSVNAMGNTNLATPNNLKTIGPLP